LTAKIEKKTLSLIKHAGLLADSMGLSAYLVGGMVRDALLGIRPGKDIDLTVEGDGLGFAQTLADDLGASYKGFEKFRTARIFLKNGFRIDVASARSERYPEPGMLPVVELAAINHDLYRRDFTINAMAVRLNKKNYGELIDPFAGQADLKAGVLKVLHSKSFTDDPTRMLRFIRFKSRFGFKADERTQDLFESGLIKNVFDTVSGERLRDEMLLMLKETKAYEALKELRDCGALAILAPGLRLSAKLKVFFNRLKEEEKEIESDKINNIVIMLIGFLGFSGDRAVESFMKRFKICNEWKTAIIQAGKAKAAAKRLSQKLKPGQVYRLLKDTVKEAVYFLKLTLGKTAAVNIDGYLKAIKRVRVLVTGDDLIKLGIKPGKKLGAILGRLMEARLDGKVNGKREELEYVKRYLL